MRSIIQKRLTAVIVLLATSSVMAQTKYERIEPSAKQMAKLQAMTPESVAAIAQINDDELEPVVIISTENAYQSLGGFTDPVRSDNFLRAFIDKASGTTRYQLDQSVRYNVEWRDFTSAVFVVDSVPQSAKLTIIKRDVVGCYASMCSYEEIVGFDLDEPVLATIADRYVAGQSPLWRFRLKAKSGIDWEERLAPAEAAGMLEAVRRWRATRQILPQPTP